MPPASTTPPTIPFFLLLSLNFPRGKGPLKNSSDVINAAKKIAEAGSRMDKLARAVADQVALQLSLCLLSLIFAIIHVLCISLNVSLTVSRFLAEEQIVNKPAWPMEIFTVGIDEPCRSSGVCFCMTLSPKGTNTERARQQNQVVSLI